jgi:nitrogen fixation-related uncharacterized protein
VSSTPPTSAAPAHAASPPPQEGASTRQLTKWLVTGLAAAALALSGLLWGLQSSRVDELQRRAERIELQRAEDHAEVARQGQAAADLRTSVDLLRSEMHAGFEAQHAQVAEVARQVSARPR